MNMDTIIKMTLAFSRRPVKMTSQMTVYPSILECLEYKAQLIKKMEESTQEDK